MCISSASALKLSIPIILYPLIIDIFRRRKPALADRDYFDPIQHDEPVPPPHVREVTEPKNR